jgi:hypothetical protein
VGKARRNILGFIWIIFYLEFSYWVYVFSLAFTNSVARAIASMVLAGSAIPLPAISKAAFATTDSELVLYAPGEVISNLHLAHGVKTGDPKLSIDNLMKYD